MAKKHAGGRPSKYTPEMCASIVRFFDIEPAIQKDITITKLDGERVEKTITEAADLPLFSDWAASVGITSETMRKWAESIPEFSVAYKRAKELQEKVLMTNGIQNRYAQPFAIFTAKNILGWRDRHEIVELKFVFDFVAQVSAASNRIIPDNCPHCKKSLVIRSELAREMNEISKKLEGAKT